MYYVQIYIYWNTLEFFCSKLPENKVTQSGDGSVSAESLLIQMTDDDEGEKVTLSWAYQVNR